MRPRDAVDLVLLAALWGASFLFMRVAAPQFGPVPMMAVRTGIGALVLLPLLLWKGGGGALHDNAGRLLAVGALNSAIPFTLLAWSTLSLSAGFTSLLNATVPLWGALVAFAWLRERPAGSQLLGLAVGVIGVTLLVRGRVSFVPGGDGFAILASLAATLSYGVAASFTRRYLSGVDPLVNATGSQIGATALLALPAVLLWPDPWPDARAWAATVTLGVACTGVAYVLYFRLIANTGPARAMTVTFLVPVFAILWGGLFLGEPLTSNMLAGGAVILVGTALSVGLLRPRRERVATPGTR